MSTSFTPPRPDQWEGPAAGFTPPPVSSWQGAAKPQPVTGPIIIRPREEMLEQFDRSFQQFNTPYQAQPAAQSPATDEERRTVLGFLGNALSSTAHLFNVPQQVQGIAALINDMSVKSGNAPVPGLPVGAVDALISQYKQRYGSLEGFEKALYQDPAGVALDASVVLGGLGGGLKLAGLPRAAAVAAKTAEIINPVTQTLRLGGAVLSRTAPLAEATGAGVKAAAPDVAIGTAKIAGSHLASHLPLPTEVKYGLGFTTAKGLAQIGSGLRKGFQAARESLTAPDVVPEVAATTEAAAAMTPGQVYAAAQGYDWARLSPEGRTAMEDAARAEANVAAQTGPAAPAAPPAAPVTPQPAAETTSLTPEDLTRLQTGRSPSEQSLTEQQGAARTLATAQAAAPQEPVVAPQTPAAAPATPPAAEATAAPAVRPAAADIAAQLEDISRVDRATDFLKANFPDVDMEKLTPEDWEHIAKGAGGQPLTAEQISQVKANMAETVVPPEMSRVPTAEVEAAAAKAVKARKARAPKKPAATPPEAAPAAEQPSPETPGTPRKEPWQMTRQEFEDQAAFRHGTSEEGARAIHEGQWDSSKRIFQFEPEGMFVVPSDLESLAEFYAKQRAGKSGSPVVVKGDIRNGAKINYRDRANIIVNPEDFITHESAVRKALSDGKPVPPEVLADYPKLRAESAPKNPAAEQPSELEQQLTASIEQVEQRKQAAGETVVKQGQTVAGALAEAAPKGSPPTIGELMQSVPGYAESSAAEKAAAQAQVADAVKRDLERAGAPTTGEMAQSKSIFETRGRFAKVKTLFDWITQNDAVAASRKYTPAEWKALTDRLGINPASEKTLGQLMKRLDAYEQATGGEKPPETPVPKTPPSTAVKEPWQMTRQEFIDTYPERTRAAIATEVQRNVSKLRQEITRAQDALQSDPGNPANAAIKSGIEANEAKIAAQNARLTAPIRPLEEVWDPAQIRWHHVESALREGKPVPPEVLADYPELSPPTKPSRKRR